MTPRWNACTRRPSPCAALAGAVLGAVFAGVLAGCSAPPAGAQTGPGRADASADAAAAASAAAIATITLERDCHGCASGTRLVLRRDGSASLDVVGKARFRTQDGSRSGRIAAAEFDALARLLVARGFFALEGVYQDPQLADGAWATITVQRAGQADKRVFRREDAGPPALADIEAAVAAQQERIVFAAAGR